MNNLMKNALIWLSAFFLLIAVFNFFQSDSPAPEKRIAFSEFLHELNHGNIEGVLIQGNIINGRLTSGSNFSTYAPYDPLLVQRLTEKGVHIMAAPREEESSFLKMLLSWLPMLVFVGIWIFFLRQMQSGGNKAISFGKSKARMLDEKKARVTFNDVAGIEEAKSELSEIVDFLKDPKKFQRLGGRIPKGVLLVGPPGTGKTLLARAIAGEANVPFYTISGSDFVEMFVGVGASRVRDMFEQGKKNAPCIIFIDEIDAVGRHRGAGMGGGNDEREQTLNQLLVEMDGFESNQGVIIIAATNRPDVLDPALLRPGRFDRQVVVSNPDIGGREKILQVHLRKVPLSKDVNAHTIARGTPGFSGADLANLVNEAALLAARLDKKLVTMSDLEQAKDKVMMGAERRSMVMTESEKRLTAYHEAGHAVVALHMPHSDPIHKATIIPRGRALGMVVRLPENDRVSMTESRMLADICVAMGGRIAEELIFGKDLRTTGASSDIQSVTSLAKYMVVECGMGDDNLSFLNYKDSSESFGGYGRRSGYDFSESTCQIVDRNVQRIVDTCFQQTQKIMLKNRHQLEKIAQGLLTYETLTGEEIKQLLEKGSVDRVSIREESEELEERRSSIDLSAEEKKVVEKILESPVPKRPKKTATKAKDISEKDKKK